MRPALLRPSPAIVFSCGCLLAAGVAGAACSASPAMFTTGTGGAGPAGSQSGAGGGTGGNPNFTTSGTGAGTTSSGGPSTFIAYTHTNKTLFKLDPNQANLGVTKIGDFDCIGGAGQDTSMTDVAVNQAGDVWGVSAKSAYHLVIQGTTVHCEKTIPLGSGSSTFYGLTFAPAGVIDAGETLIAGNTAGELWQIDTTSGTLSQHGTFGTVPADDGHGHTYKYHGKAWELSGDLVFLSNNNMPIGFATVRDCKSPPSSTSCNSTDTLIEIDMAKLKAVGAQDVTLKVRGAIVKKAGCSDTVNTSYGGMYGIAAWNDKVYGFSNKGDIVEIDNTDGSACLLIGGMNHWDGAGVTTSAPVIKPPN